MASSFLENDLRWCYSCVAMEQHCRFDWFRWWPSAVRWATVWCWSCLCCYVETPYYCYDLTPSICFLLHLQSALTANSRRWGYHRVSGCGYSQEMIHCVNLLSTLPILGGSFIFISNCAPRYSSSTLGSGGICVSEQLARAHSGCHSEAGFVSNCSAFIRGAASWG